MKIQTILARALGILALCTASASAASVTSSATAPAINDADLANYGAVSATDKWWGTVGGDNNGRGQTFVTGPGALRLKSITYQTATASIPTKVFKIRVGKISGTTFTPVYAENATQSANWGAKHYVTWSFANPPLLDGGTVYGVDVIMVSSTTHYNPHFPALRSDPMALSGASRRKQTPSSHSRVRVTGVAAIHFSYTNFHSTHLGNANVTQPYPHLFRMR